MTTPDVVSAMAWHPRANCLALICENGQAALWKDIIPRTSGSKTAGLSSAVAAGSGMEDAGNPLLLMTYVPTTFRYINFASIFRAVRAQNGISSS